VTPLVSARTLGLADLFTAVPPGRLLAGPRAHALATAAGTGSLVAGDLDLTRWRGDRVEDSDGVFFYVRDLDGGAVWSAGYQPTRCRPTHYTVRMGEGCVEITREDEGIETVLETVVAPDAAAALYRVRLTNHSDRPRRLDVTSYAEVVLAPRAFDLGHPGFAKLFVETERVTGRPALLARRRPRGADEEPRWLYHTLAGGDAVTHETDRARFLGRGRGVAAPAMLDAGAVLDGTTGCVLDPVVVLRAEAALAPGESRTFVFTLGAADTRDEALAAVDRFSRCDDGAFDAADRYERTLREGLGLSEEETEVLHDDAVRRLYTRTGEDADDRVLFFWEAMGLPRWAREVSVAPSTNDASFDAPGDPVALPASGALVVANGEKEEELLFWNGYGGFSADGTEYVLRLLPGPDGRPQLPPLPWTNVAANERAGFVASERGTFHTWAGNSRVNRLTPWSNDPVSDPHGEALYVRDEETGRFWSPTPGPVPAPAPYEVRHGYGATRYRIDWDGLALDTVVFVPTEDPLKLVRVRVTNHSDRSRTLALYSYARLVLGALAEEEGPTTETSAEGGIVRAQNAASERFPEAVAFAAAVAPQGMEATADRAAFLGPQGSPEAPRILLHGGPLAPAAGPGYDGAAVLRAPLTIAPGATEEVTFLLGQGADAAETDQLLTHYSTPEGVEEALEGVKRFWAETLGAVQVKTPVPELDVLANGWLLYQNLACRMRGRSAFYQSGGAYGFRDQLQDALSLVYTRPDLTRRQIVLHAGHQFVEGDVLHWWHPPDDGGIRTRFADDLLWLPLAASFYVGATGDRSVLDEEAPFLTARELEDGEDEVFLYARPSGQTGSVYVHCCRALDRSLKVGLHGLPLMGTGDWNDGMNRVGREGRGESVWMGFFLSSILTDFIPLCEARGEHDRAAGYRAFQKELDEALNREGSGWDGRWYRRAYYDDGAVLGSAESDECQIDAIAQAWAVLSGVAPPEKATQALDALEERLVDEEAGIIRLLTPAFDTTPHDPGYIKGYVPGVRENGGQYTHAALWAVRALAAAGRRERAAPLLAMLSPVRHTRTPEAVARYRAEPYVVAADVYGVAPHVGRGGWTWYTGSAGWMYRVFLESVLGLTLEGGTALVLRPVIPAEWPGFSIQYRTPTGTYTVAVTNGPGGHVSAATLDGAALEVEGSAVRVPLTPGDHHVTVSLG